MLSPECVRLVCRVFDRDNDSVRVTDSEWLFVREVDDVGFDVSDIVPVMVRLWDSDGVWESVCVSSDVVVNVLVALWDLVGVRDTVPVAVRLPDLESVTE